MFGNRTALGTVSFWCDVACSICRENLIILPLLYMVETFSAPVTNAHWMDEDAIRFCVEHQSQKLIPGAEVPERVKCSHSLSGDWIPEWTAVSPEIFPLVTGGKFHFGFLFSVPPHLSEPHPHPPQYFFSILSPGCSEHLCVVVSAFGALVLFPKDFSKNLSGEVIPQWWGGRRRADGIS